MVIATVIAVLILEGAGEIDGMPEHDRCAWGDWLHGCQDAATGIFADPLLDKTPIEDAEHGREYFDHMCRYFAARPSGASAAIPGYVYASDGARMAREARLAQSVAREQPCDVRAGGPHLLSRGGGQRHAER